MSFAVPSMPTIRRHCGDTSYRRGWKYFVDQHVDPGTVGAGQVSADVLGRAGYYEVRVWWEGDALKSACSCPVRSSCKHVAALLFTVQDAPGLFERVEVQAEQEYDPLVFADKGALLVWAEERHISDLLLSPLHDVFRSSPGLWTLSRAAPLLQDLMLLDLSAQTELVSGYARNHLLGVDDWLAEITKERAAVVAYSHQAEVWRSVAPAEPELLALWTALREWPEPLSWDWGLTETPTLKGAVLEDPPTLRLKGVGALPIQSSEPLSQDLEAELVACALDLITHPELAKLPMRKRLCKVLRTPAWERALQAMDHALEPVQSDLDVEGRALGWRVDLLMQSVECVLTRPYKTRGGLRAWKHKALLSGKMMQPQDVRLAGILEAVPYTNVGRSLSLNRCLEALVGHPWVLSKEGQHIEVRRGSTEMAWVPLEDGGLRLELRVQGRAVSREELKSVVRDCVGGLSHLQRGEQLYSLALDLPQLRVLRVLLDRGATFPIEATQAVMQRLEAFSNVTRLRLEGDLKGAEVEGDARPLLRLTPEPEGGISVEALIRPLEGANAWPPGVGPTQIYRIQDGKREFVKRELSQESARIDAVLMGLELQEEPMQEHRVLLYDPERALDLVGRVQEQSTHYQIEWTRAKPKVSRQATANDLKLRGANKRNWFGLSGGIEVDGVEVNLAELLAAVRGGRRYVAVGDAEWVALSDSLRSQLEVLATLGKDRKDGVELPMLSSAAMLPLQEAGAQVELSKSLRLQLSALQEAQTLDIPLPQGLQATLRPYQEEGFRWMARLAHWAPGAVLADDMGLGKTVQALALLLRRAAGGPALVIAPASVGINWMREAARFAPSLRVLNYRGAQRGELLKSAGAGQVLVTSWELMTRDVDALKGVFHTVVMDEAQAIKNHNTRRARASADLAGDFTLALTGTPVENRVGELWSLMRTTVPGLLGSAERFRARVVVPIERDNDPAPRRALSALISPFMLRRLKSQVALDLPQRTESVLSVELSQEERRLYDQFRLATLAELDAGSDPVEGGQKRFRILAAMTRLRQLACHPGLVHAGMMEGGSTKLRQLVRRLVDLKAEGHRALVFSQFTTLLGLAREAAQAAGLSTKYLDGSTPIRKRQEQVDAFQAGEGDVFLISLKAGGTGLNLTAASYVFHLDPWWNPAVEDQATDRVHRIGQTQPVFVTRLVAVDTIEEQVLEMHAEKRGLVSELLAGTGKASALSTNELIMLLQSEGEVEVSMETVASSAPAALETVTVPVSPPTNNELLARYSSTIQAEIDGGVLRSSTAAVYLRATRNLLIWTQAQQGVVQDATSLELWIERYCEALRSGELRRGVSDLKSGKAAWRRLGELL